jgi:transposase
VALLTEQGHSVTKAAASLGLTDKLLNNWKAKVGKRDIKKG